MASGQLWAPEGIENHIAAGQMALHDGDLDRAAAFFEASASLDPRRIEPILGLSMVRASEGRLEDALDHAERAVRIDPHVWQAFNQLGSVLRDLERPADARAAFRKARQLGPTCPETWFNAGALELAEKDYKRAERYFGKAVALDDTDAEALQSFGLATALNGDFARGIDLLQAALQLDPRSPSAWNDAGFIARAKNDLPQAEQCFRQAVNCAPDYAIGWANLATVFVLRQDFESAVIAQRESVRFDDDQKSRLLLVDYLIRVGQTGEARHEMASGSASDSPSSLWRQMLCSLSNVYADEAEAVQARTDFETHMKALEDAQAADTAGDEESWCSALDAGFPFLLAAQGQDDRELNGRLGHLAGRTLARLDDGKSAQPRRGSGARKVRIGIVSGAFCNHSVWKVNTKGWLDSFDRDHFDLYGYRVGGWWDKQTDVAAAAFRKFEGKERAVGAWIDQIRSDHLDILVYPEVGMQSHVWQLATRRLAPVQVSTFGHPVTTGLPSFDYFFSGAAMEPEDGDDHYSERLVRLPNLGMVFSNETTLDDAFADEVTWARTALAAEGRIVYWCCQALHKYRPCDDDLYPTIARAVPTALFAFIVPQAVRAAFERRLHRAFAAHGLRFEDFCRLLPQMSGQRFVATSSCADIFLDTIGWSGMTTTLENLAFDTPIVTMAGRFMRGRHTAGILTVAGLEDWISPDKAAYVARAIRLASPTERGAARTQLATSKDKVFRDAALAPTLNAALTRIAAR